MSLVKPIISTNSYGTIVFDASLLYTFNFIANSGDQYIGNNLILSDNSNGTEVYNQTISTFTSTHPLPAGTLINGKIYQAKIRTKDVNGNYSNFSDLVVFQCLSSPTLQFTNIIDGKIGNATYNFQLSYFQSELEIPQSYRFYLYDSTQTLITTSGDILYAQDPSLQYQFAGFEDGSKYYIKANLVTQHYIEISTVMVEFSANFLVPKLNAVLEATNNPSEGSVLLTANIVQIIGESSDGSVINYINNEEIDLVTNHQTVYWQDGFSIDGDFTLKIWLRDMQIGQVFITLYGQQGRIEIKYDGEKIILHRIMNKIAYYYITSEKLNDINTPLFSTDKVFIFVQQDSSTMLMNLRAEILK